MGKGVVLVYFARLGGRLTSHQEIMLDADAKIIAELMGYEFGGRHRIANDYSGHPFFVPDDTLLLDEARFLGIHGPGDLYGGVVSYPFVKTKAIAHQLVDDGATRPEGWSSAFAERVRNVVLPGYTVFSAYDARIAAKRMLARGTIRVKKPLGASGKGQTIVKTIEELDAFLESFSPDEMDTYGLVLEENLCEVTTLSVGLITVGRLTIAYHGTQRITKDNKGRSVYGGSDLVCVRGGWKALEGLAITPEVRAGVTQSKLFDEAMNEYPGFIASRRNYDVGQGIDAEGQRRSGVFESSWRVGGATSAELVALAAFIDDPSLRIVEASHVEKYGRECDAPRGAVIHFQGDDPQAGPLIRYTTLTRTSRIDNTR
jgi:hypothetical protein